MTDCISMIDCVNQKQMRLKADIWVQSLLRRAQIEGAMATIAQRGDRDSGSVMIRVNKLNGFSDLLAPMTGLEGHRLWRFALPPDSADADVEAAVQRECARDPDLWIVEIEDRAGRSFLEEKIEDNF